MFRDRIYRVDRSIRSDTMFSQSIPSMVRLQFHITKFWLKTNQNEWSFNEYQTVRDCVAFHVPTEFRSKKLHDNPTSYLFSVRPRLASSRICAFVFSAKSFDERTNDRKIKRNSLGRKNWQNKWIFSNGKKKKKSKRQTDIIIYNVFMHISFMLNSCIIICRKIRIVFFFSSVCVCLSRIYVLLLSIEICLAVKIDVNGWNSSSTHSHLWVVVVLQVCLLRVCVDTINNSRYTCVMCVGVRNVKLRGDSLSVMATVVNCVPSPK